MNKILLLSLLLLVGSCSLWQKTPESFEEHYKSYISHSIKKIDVSLDEIGFMKGGSTSGVFDALVSLPVPLSGSLKFDYKLDRSGRDASLSLGDGRFQYDGMAGSGGVDFDALKLISEKGNMHFLFENIKSTTPLSTEMESLLKKYNDTWLTWTQAESRAGVTNVTELQNLILLENISGLRLSKIETYLTSYPLWHSTGDATLSGSVKTWEVSLDREKTLNLINTVKADMTGSGLTEQEFSNVRSALSGIELGGSMSFDSEDSSFFETHLTLTGTGGQKLALLDIMQNQSRLTLRVHDVLKDTDLDSSIVSTDTRMDIQATLSQSGTQLAHLMGYKTHPGEWPRELSLELNSDGQITSIKNSLSRNGAFTGQLLFPLTSVSWNGLFNGKSLSMLTLQGASPEGAIDMNLIESDGMARGPLVIRMGEEELFRANVGILLEPTAFRFLLDIPQGTGATESIHSELGLTFDNSLFDTAVSAPSSSIPFRNFLEELNALAPEEPTGDTEPVSVDEAGGQDTLFLQNP